jgi:hypothetical protein
MMWTPSPLGEGWEGGKFNKNDQVLFYTPYNLFKYF